MQLFSLSNTSIVIVDMGTGPEVHCDPTDHERDPGQRGDPPLQDPEQGRSGPVGQERGHAGLRQEHLRISQILHRGICD